VRKPPYRHDAAGSRISNDEAARSSVLGPPAGMLGGENSSGFEVDLRHAFLADSPVLGVTSGSLRTRISQYGASACFFACASDELSFFQCNMTDLSFFDRDAVRV
jgi:hypothetical protein